MAPWIDDPGWRALSRPANAPTDTLPALLPPPGRLLTLPARAAPDAVRAWFDAAVEAAVLDPDGSLAGERAAAETYARLAKAENTRRAYRVGVRAWCA